MISSVPVFLSLAALAPLASAHIAFWHNSMYGFNVTANTFSYDNRPVVPLMQMTFQQWWFHNHLGYPPNPGDVFELPAGQSVNTELSCDKGATSWWNSSSGGDAGYGTDWPCPGQPSSEFHTTGESDAMGCALAIAYKPDATQVQPDDFVVFSINQTCVWTLNTLFEVPEAMPPCPDGGCTCAWFWIHSPDSGQEQMYMNGFKCNVTGSTSNTPIGQPALARRCGADPTNGRPNATPGNCTTGPKWPFYWDQLEDNNMFEGLYSPPVYNDLYGFFDGAQKDIFQDAFINSLGAGSGSGSAAAPTGSASSSVAPVQTPAPTFAPAPAPSPSATDAPAPAPLPADPSSSSDSPADPSSSNDSPAPSPTDSSPSGSPPAPSPTDSFSGSDSDSTTIIPTSVAISSVYSGSPSVPISSFSVTPSSPVTIPLTSATTLTCRPRPTGSSRRRRRSNDTIIKRHKRRLHHVQDHSFH
ncbi:hypothetical protein AcV5_008732 [Taiwanofungus camphoratus]|nr:hypothetical protein AcV5_008732 [Antrodia cinnamomea]